MAETLDKTFYWLKPEFRTGWALETAIQRHSQLTELQATCLSLSNYFPGKWDGEGDWICGSSLQIWETTIRDHYEPVPEPIAARMVAAVDAYEAGHNPIAPFPHRF